MYNGQEVNYLFRGTHQPAPDFPRHNHTKYAMNYLEERFVGEIEVLSVLPNFTASSQEIVEWKMTAIEHMEGDSNMVEFQATNGYVRQLFDI